MDIVDVNRCYDVIVQDSREEKNEYACNDECNSPVDQSTPADVTCNELYGTFAEFLPAHP